jgi:hypothetical protein
MITQEFELKITVHLYSPGVARASVATHLVLPLPLYTSAMKLFVVPSLAISKLSDEGPRFAPIPLPKSIILSQACAEPKFASKSMVIPPLNVFVARSGRSMNGPAALVPPGNLQAPEAASMSKLFWTVSLLVAWLFLPERSRTEVLVLIEFRSEEL